MNPTLTVFIGYDERQPEAYKACKQSILETSSRPVKIIPLKHQELRETGFFARPWTITERGEFIDGTDGKPFSTQFSHTRFLVPYLAQNKYPCDFAIFVDSDFIFLTDIYKLISYANMQPRQPVYCVKHEYASDTDTKMDNRNQFNYNKKLWTSLMLFDVKHPLLKNLDPYIVNTKSGRDMHQFKWLGALPDTNIGLLPHAWNFIPGHSESKMPANMPINAIHYTLGTPHMEGFENCDYSDFYWNAYMRAIHREYSELADQRWKKVKDNVNS